MRPTSQLSHMRPSPIRKIYEKAITMEDVVFFCLGEPDFDTPVCAVDEAIASLRRGETHYTPTPGSPICAGPPPRISPPTTGYPMTRTERSRSPPAVWRA